MFRPSLTFARHLQLTSKRTVLSRKPNAPSRLFSKAPPPPLNSTADLSGLPAELTKGVGKRFNAPLSEGELVKLQEHVAKHGSWSKFYQETSNKWVQREVLLDWICRYDQFRGNSPIAANAVKALECVAASLLAVIGVTYSGLAGMNVVGCSVVGCAAALGGSTFSDIMTGRLARGGVFWARDPRFLALTLMSSLATFYALPSYETATATSLLNSIRSTAGLSPSSGISLPTFEKALVLSAELRENLKTVLLPRLDQDIQLAIKTSPSVEEEARIIFEVLDGDGNEVLDVSELLPLSRHTLTASKTFWYAESIALSSLSVVTAQSCIVRGLNPLSSIVIATLGGCVGGVMRDILCGRSMKEDLENYAMCTFTGGSALILMRQMVIRGARIPLSFRLSSAFMTTIATRWYLDSNPSPSPISTFQPPKRHNTTTSFSNAAGTLCDAASRGDFGKVKELITKNKIPVDSRDYDRRTALHLAAAEGEYEVVKLLIESRAGINVRDRWGHTPHDEAVRGSHQLVAKYLDQHGGV
ncbi:hypothetical protein TrLO_g1685 [Triparma laevis f. longispina]|uniref:Glycine transporter domain-containing protein n=1 Tax=Triparma laevis f. longispina TaxID=1714387 RepID=A0A9W7KZK5_9STRA|nr:hypothetical protein TrLO_g1685 [Triparma laevis f. longispina]